MNMQSGEAMTKKENANNTEGKPMTENSMEKARKKLNNAYAMELEQAAIVASLKGKIKAAEGATVEIGDDIDLVAIRQRISETQKKHQNLTGELAAAEMVLVSIQKQRINALMAVYAAEHEIRQEERSLLIKERAGLQSEITSLRAKLEVIEGKGRLLDRTLDSMNRAEETVAGKCAAARLAGYEESLLRCRDRQKFHDIMESGQGGTYVTIDERGEFIEPQQTSRDVDQWGYQKPVATVQYSEPRPIENRVETPKREVFTVVPMQA